MDQAELQARLVFAEAIALEAGHETLRWFNQPGLTADAKGDGSPVTAADRAAERLLRHRIEATYPDDAILGEEFDDRPGTSGWRWVLDPIDGTHSFVRGVPLYGTMVGCEFAGSPALGVIRMPALRETVAAAQETPGHWVPAGDQEPRPLTCGNATSLSEALTLWTCPEVYRTLGVLPSFQKVQQHAGMVRGWSDCYAFVLAATGRADAVVEAGLQPWDLVAAIPILHAAGLTVTDWDGNANPAGKTVLATAPAVHRDLLELLDAAPMR